LKIDSPLISVQNGYLIARRFLRASLIQNASFLFGAEVVNSLFGFLFWSVAAKLYSPDAIGKASAVISAAGLISLLSGFGLGDGLVRLLPESSNKGKLVSTVLIFTGAIAAGFAALFLLLPSVRADDLDFLHGELYIKHLFFGLCTFAVVQAILSMVYLARKKTGYVMLQAVLSNIIRLGLVLTLPALGFTGLLAANLMGIIAAVTAGLLIYIRAVMNHPLKLEFSFAELIDVFPYAFGNYVSSLLGQIPQRILPFVALLLLGTSSAGYGHIAWIIGGFITIPGLAISSSAFSEASNDPERSKNVFQRAFYAGIIITIFLSFGLFFIAHWLLTFFGPGYVQEGTALLRWLALAAPMIVVNGLYFATLRYQKRMRQLIITSGILTVATISAAYFAMPRLGLAGYGVGWVFGHMLVLLVIIFDPHRNKLSNKFLD